MNYRPDEIHNILWIEWPCEGHLPLCCYTGQPYLLCEALSHLQFRCFISDWKMLFTAFWGANGWPLLPRWWWLLMTRFCGEEGPLGVHTPPGSISTLLAMYRHYAPWVTLSLSILMAGCPLEILLSFMLLQPYIVFQQSKIKAKS